jgi:hypothetical protein
MKRQVEKDREYGKIQELRKKWGAAPLRGNGRQVGLESIQTLQKKKIGDSTQREVQWTLAGQSAIKLEVREAGWYRVSQPELVAAGLDPRVNPKTLRLFAGGEEIPISVEGEKDGQLDPGDGIEFYGEGLDTASTDTQVYWLSIGPRAVRRIKILNGQGGRAGAKSYPSTVERKDRTFYFAALRNGEGDNFFGPFVTTEPVDQVLTLQNLDSSPPGEAWLEVGLQGLTKVSHRVKILLNDMDVGEAAFEGQAHGVMKIEVPQGWLREKENLVTVVAENGETDMSLIDTIRLTYWHTYTADGEMLRFSARGGEQITIDGFTQSRIRVIDITDPKGVEEVIGVVEARKGGYGITIKTPGAGVKTLMAFTEEKIKRPVSIRANEPSSWHQRDHMGDLVIITPRDFLESVKPLKKNRETQGWKVALIDIEDLYDEYSFGVKEEEAIKDFLKEARGNWKRPPRHVLLVGDASFDRRNYLGFGNFDFIPTKIIETAYFETASDDWYVDFDNNGLPEIAMGRLPVRTTEEATAVVSKIVGYEQGRRGAWAGQALMVADQNDGFNFERASEEVGVLLPRDMTVWEIFRGQSDEETARSALLGSINDGQLLVNYMGHGSTEIWQGSLLTSDDAPSLTNSLRLPFFILMTCLNGLFHDVYTESLAEALLKAGQGGAIAVWASSGMTEPEGQVLMNQELIRLLFNSESLTLGEAVRRAKRVVSDQDIRRTWILFGDPTTKLKR